MTLTAAHLLPGTDREFVVNAYLAILGRWPDEGGLAHHLGFVAGRPERRIEALRNMLASEEAKLRGCDLPLDGAASPAEAAAAQLRLRVDFLLEARAAPPPAAPIRPWRRRSGGWPPSWRCCAAKCATAWRRWRPAGRRAAAGAASVHRAQRGLRAGLDRGSASKAGKPHAAEAACWRRG
jgi:hypothetical protein